MKTPQVALCLIVLIVSADALDRKKVLELLGKSILGKRDAIVSEDLIGSPISRGRRQAAAGSVCDTCINLAETLRTSTAYDNNIITLCVVLESKTRAKCAKEYADIRAKMANGKTTRDVCADEKMC